MTALFPSLSLFLPVPIFSWLHLLLRQGTWVCCLALLMVVRTLAVGPGVSYASWLSFALHQALDLLVPVATLLPLDSLPSRWGHPCGVEDCLSSIGRRFSVPVWVRYTGQFMVGPHASVCGVSAHPVPQGVLPGGPRCVRELRLSLAPSSVLHCPMLGFSVASTTFAAGLGLSWVPCPTFCRLGFCTSVGGSACALQPLAPSYRVVLTEAAGLGRFLVLSIVLPWP